MYKISIEKDHDKMIFDLTGMTSIPAIGPDSDMDGHDLSSLTYSETLRAEEFVDNFNEKYADKAFLGNFFGVPAILVKDFMLDDEEEINPDDYCDWDEMVPALTATWKQLFNMSDKEIEEYLEKYKQILGK